MSFLSQAGLMSQVPVDPINNMTGDNTSGMYSYRYYCYPTGAGNPGLHLGYWTEAVGGGNHTETVKNITNSAGVFTDTTFVCN